VVTAGVHRAQSIKVAEAAKVIENTQRDLNIALMNELALIFDRMGIRTKDVLDAAGTKWNFLRFTPGLVGGHCIGVDPYYLTTKAEELGYLPEVILAGRRINNNVGPFIAQKCVQLLSGGDLPRSRREGRHPRPDVQGERPRSPQQPRARHPRGAPPVLEPMVADSRADADEAHHEYGIHLTPLEKLTGLDAVVFAVSHDEYKGLGGEKLHTLVHDRGVVIDVKSMIDPKAVPAGLAYWCL
jgi:UDP-N-acetyl-D-galactosamine dehydrogenase